MDPRAQALQDIIKQLDEGIAAEEIPDTNAYLGKIKEIAQKGLDGKSYRGYLQQY